LDIVSSVKMNLSCDLFVENYKSVIWSHSETTILKVLSDLLAVVDRGDVGVLVLFDLSAAFDNVEHTIVLKLLERAFRVSGVALAWLSCGPRTVCQAWCRFVWHGYATVGLTAGSTASTAATAAYRTRSTVSCCVHCRPHRRHPVKPSAPACVRRWYAPVDQGTFLLWLLAAVALSRLSLNGCGQTGCNSMRIGRKFFGWHRPGYSISCHRSRWSLIVK
jgi:hypothetical protein